MEPRPSLKRARVSERAPPGQTYVARSEPRVRTHLRPGQILDLNRNPLAECLICDVSLHGARLKMHSHCVELPRLLLVYDERSRGILHAEVRWHRNNEIGIFVGNGTASLVSR